MEQGKRRIEGLLKKADRALQEGIRKADRVIDDAEELGTITARQAARASRGIHARAKKEGDQIRSRAARDISKGVSAAKRMTTDTRDDLEALEVLGRLRKSKVITEKEFREKKKRILDRI
ncbi:MAG: SHOCT domain-containing protein [Nitrosopumilus sp.]|nr:SHOCT domain-containing protein [Nitrosopumilus sp.]CAI9831513.1 conserved hypothetical protein [Nitrosopumilaceae archaeon]MDA7940797.1 SHOCT domain-containing protein [Nitrosopumilus sp.]MDA7943005.1 SHOCT domain-containing protein [Nitrosopumilus sp.]MDA7944584.1 SHOCT domain-containing protein [Nitrosopumilus sp.]